MWSQYITCVEAQKASLQDGVGVGQGKHTERVTEETRMVPEDQRSDFLFQAPSCPKAFLHLAPGL